MILQADEAEDWLATGKTTTVRDFCKMALQKTGISLRFEGEGGNERIIDSIDVEKYQISKLIPSNGQRMTDNGNFQK
jgi:GDPmannose 4,6-dehydratase